MGLPIIAGAALFRSVEVAADGMPQIWVQRCWQHRDLGHHRRVRSSRNAR